MRNEPEPDTEEPESWFVDGAIKLLASVVIVAARDARKGSREARDFLERAGIRNVDDVQGQLHTLCRRI